MCELKTIFADDGTTITGFNIEDTFGECPAVANGWTYSTVTNDEEGNLESYTGPDDDVWNFYLYDDLFAELEEPEDFYLKVYGAVPFDDYFNYENVFAMFETYTSSMAWFYYYDSDGSICELKAVEDDESNIIGYDVLDSYDGACP